MRFGRQNLANCDSALLAHSLHLPGLQLRKGHRLSRSDLDICRQANLDSLIVAQLEAGDIHEDEVARQIAEAMLTPALKVGISKTGRANLYAKGNGLLMYEPAGLASFNAVDEGLTVALLPPYTPVRAGQMIGTVKVIPFALPEHVLACGLKKCPNIELNVHMYQPKSATLLQTALPETKASVLTKTVTVTRARMEHLDSTLIDAGQMQHDTEALAVHLRDIETDIILIVGASAIADRSDVIPAAILLAGGSVSRFGMPVDPGNLLCLGRLGRATVIGLPGCARSPKRNGFDMVLERLCAGQDISNIDIAAMGSGGLLDDVPERALPRARLDQAHAEPPCIGVLLLAAGRSSRMGSENKLLLPTATGPLVRHVATTAHTAGISDIIAVLGYQAESVGQALRGSVSHMVFNPDFANGMAASIRAGLAAAPAHWDAAFVMLGDMPLIKAESLKALMAAYDPSQGRSIIVPLVHGQRANPVLWSREHWPQLLNIQGDVGGKALLAAAGDAVCEVALEDEGLLRDVDDPASWQAIKAIL
jgi:molybdenum cofactor cytidylyltransferase